MIFFLNPFSLQAVKSHPNVYFAFALFCFFFFFNPLILLHRKEVMINQNTKACELWQPVSKLLTKKLIKHKPSPPFTICLPNQDARKNSVAPHGKRPCGHGGLPDTIVHHRLLACHSPPLSFFSFKKTSVRHTEIK